MKRKSNASRKKIKARVVVQVEWKRYASWLFGGMFLLVSAFAMGSLVMTLSEADTLPLRTVKIRGDIVYLDIAKLEKRIAGLTRAGFFSVNVEAIRNAAEDLPWVQSISVRRVWPDRLDVYVKERDPLAFWGRTGLIDHDGFVFEPENIEQVSGIPRLAGPNEDTELLVDYFARYSRMLSEVNQKLVQLSLDERGSWTLVLENGVIVRLGHDQVEARVSRLVRYISLLEHDAEKRVESIDLRYTNGFAIQTEKLPKKGVGQG